MKVVYGDNAWLRSHKAKASRHAIAKERPYNLPLCKSAVKVDRWVVEDSEVTCDICLLKLKQIEKKKNNKYAVTLPGLGRQSYLPKDVVGVVRYAINNRMKKITIEMIEEGQPS